MKRGLSKWQGLLAAASLVLVTAGSSAQPSVDGGAHLGKMLSHAADELDLSEAQRNEVREQLAGFSASVAADRTRMKELREELQALRVSFDEGKATTLTDEMGQIGARMAYEMAKAEAGIYGVLSAEQQAAFDEMKAGREARKHKDRHWQQQRGRDKE
jgi:Spy/CpxP family protein refolding chaperone